MYSNVTSISIHQHLNIIFLQNNGRFCTQNDIFQYPETKSVLGNGRGPQAT